VASKYPHGYTYDLFVSYSSWDAGWVTPFLDDLTKEVNRFGTHDIHPFLDKHRIQPGHVWDPAIMDAVADSAILVPVLSPRFFERYCNKEVEAFVKAHPLSSATAHRSRILPAQLLAAAPPDHILSKVQTTAFCREGADGVPYEFRRGTPEYDDALRRLAYAIAQLLNSMPPIRQGRAAVYLATDYKPPSDKLRASLKHHFDVLPTDPMALMGLTSEELQESLEKDFARCFASIHPLGNAPMAQPLIDAQITFAQAKAKPRLVWTPDRPDHLTSQGFEWFTLQAEIEDRIRRLYEKPAPSKSTSSAHTIYFLCPDQRNRGAAEPVLSRLKERGVHSYVSPYEGSAEQVMQEHVNLLDELDGCLIYYGDVDRSWFDGIFPRLRKKIRQRGLRTVIYSGPPPSDHKRDLQFQDWTVVHDADAAALAFLGAMS
jgi:hypothetical protein